MTNIHTHTHKKSAKWMNLRIYAHTSQTLFELFVRIFVAFRIFGVFGISTDQYFPPFSRENISSLWRILIIRIIFLCRSRSAFTVLCTHVSTVCANYVRSCCKNKRILVWYFFRLLAAAKFSNKCRLYGLKMIYNCCVV